jgi:hypothetical protein
MGIGRNWTKEEKEYLCEKWGTVSVSTIAKKLNRTETAIIVRSQRMGLGAFLESGDYITWNQLQIALGMGTSGSGYKMVSWVQNRNFPLHTKRIRSNTFKVVYLEEFWEWAEKNQTFLDFSKFEPYSLGMEPDWVQEKRRQDYSGRSQVKMTPWTASEDKRLARLVKKHQYGFRELSHMMGRTEGAIQRRLSDLEIKDRPVKADNTIKWTDAEFTLLGEMIIKGKRYEQMAEVLEKSVKAIRGRVYQMYLTENLDKARDMIGNGPWGAGRPERKVKHYLQMSQEEKAQTKDLVTRLAAIIRNQYKQCFDQSDYWQKELCQLWDGYCTAGESNCDECTSFQRIKPQYCKRCGKTFYERKQNLICKPCRSFRRSQHMKKVAVLID